MTHRFVRRVATVSLILAVAAACADTASDTTSTTVPGTTTIAPVTTTTTPPVDTSTTTTTLAETTTTTTEAPTSGVIVGFEGILGWWDGSGWRSLADGEPPAADGDVYQLLLIGEETTEVVGGEVTGG